MTFHPEIQEFADLLHQIEAVLSEHDQEHWAMQVAGCLTSVERSDAYGVRRFLSFFGGMGSLNDVFLHRAGEPLTVENDQFRALLGKAWKVGRDLQRDDDLSERPLG